MITLFYILLLFREILSITSDTSEALHGYSDINIEPIQFSTVLPYFLKSFSA